MGKDRRTSSGKTEDYQPSVSWSLGLNRTVHSPGQKSRLQPRKWKVEKLKMHPMCIPR